MDACARAEKAGDIGRAFVLPSSHPGSPRQMHELFQDAMAIVGKYGKPDLFITFTCNPKWKEIQENLMPGQTSWDRPDIVCRVFKEKLDEFLDDLYKKGVFGRAKAGVHVIEFQKRGLPHCHCLIILEDEYKLKTSKQVDRAIWAEIPDEREYPVLFERVIKHMIHMPCNSEFRKCKPKRGNQCNRNFPKQFQERTSLSTDSYPVYRRRRRPAVWMKYKSKNISISNRWVVPYNPYLLMKYNAHINVEMCNTITAVKYLYKYIYKGYDRAIVQLDNLDEITRYKNCRYVSSVEGFWRTKSNYKMNARFPVVERLPVHLEKEHELFFTKDAELADLLDKTDTQLTAWFALNRRTKEFKHLLYFDMPKYFTWNKKDKEWVPRSQNKLNKNRPNSHRTQFDKEHKNYEDIVVRTYSISPKETERFFLNIILRNKPGAESFADLRTVDEVIYPSYRRAASKMGLLDDDQIWVKTLEDSVLVNTNARKLRQLFSHMLIHCEINDPLALWNQFKDKLGDDFKRKFEGISADHLDELILTDIQQILHEFDKELADYKLPVIPETSRPEFSGHCTFSPNELSSANQEFEVLTDEQKAIYLNVEVKLIARQQGKLSDSNLIYLDAPGGTGKTFLLNVISKGMSKKNFKVIAVAHTGVAAILLHNGRTAHSMFRLPLEILEGDQAYCDIPKVSQLADSLRETDLIIWDEIATTSNRFLTCLSRTLNDICSMNNCYFANKIMLFAGDYRQILPIVQYGTREEITAQIIKNTDFWHKVEKCKLTKNLRLKGDQEDFAKYLLAIGEGRVEKNEEDEIELDPRLIHKGDLNKFIEHFYGKELREKDYQRYESTAILAPLNEDVHYLNALILAKLKSKNKERTYLSRDVICPQFSQLNLSTELLNSINQSGLPLHKLTLKTGAIAFIIRNINPTLGICNGTRIVITELHDNLVVGMITSGKFKNTVVEVPRISLYSDEKRSIQFKRTQFPLILAFATTLNKIQGQTLKKVGLYLKNDIFSHGHLYVGMTRPELFENIRVFFNEPGRTTTPNIVYPEVFDEELLNRIQQTGQPPSPKPTKLKIKIEPESNFMGAECKKPAEPAIHLNSTKTISKSNFSSEVESKIESVLSVQDMSSIVIEKFRIEITRRDIEFLQGTNWLNDSLIDFYLELIQEKYPSVFCFDIFFLQSLQIANSQPFDLRRRSTPSNLLMNNLILVPVHRPQHWALITIKPRERRIEYYDSLGWNGEQYLSIVEDYLKSRTGENEWTLENIAEIPRQDNNSDCGVFLCQYAIHLAKNQEFSFDQSSMPLKRKQMIYEISQATLLD